MIKTNFRLRPSSAARWLQCPESVLLERNHRKTRSTRDIVHAARGSAAHDILERCILEQTQPTKFLGTKVAVNIDDGDFDAEFVVDSEIVDCVSRFLFETNALEGPGNVYPELNIQHSAIPELTGTTDFLRINGTHAKIYDYKHGTAPVMARSRNGKLNPQLACYAALVLDKFVQIETFTIGVVQPRIKTIKKVRKTESDRHEIRKFVEQVWMVRARIDRMLEGSSPMQPTEGSYCWYCPASAVCPAKQKTQLSKDFS